MEQMTRRDFIKTTLLTGTLTIMGISCSKKRAKMGTNELHIYNWPYYISENTRPNFEKEFGVKTTYDNYSSDDELLAKLQTGAKGYDLIFPSDSMVRRMKEKNLLEELDMNNIPNFKNIGERFRNLEFDPGNKYSVPYFWGTTGIGYNSDKVKEKVDSWKIFWDEKYKGRISMLDDLRGIANPPLKILGYSINTIEPAQLEKAKQMLLKQKPLVKAYSSDTYVDFLKSGDIWLAQAYSGDVYQAIKANKMLKYVIPKEGTDLWIDNMCIPKGAKNKVTAEEFINYVLRPEVSADISNATWYANPNEASVEFIRPEIKDNPSIYPTEEMLRKCEFQKDIKESLSLYEKIYNDVKSA